MYTLILNIKYTLNNYCEVLKTLKAVLATKNINFKLINRQILKTGV